VIENDDRLYTLRDCLRIHEEIGIPVLFDVFHHEVNSSGETVWESLKLITQTWGKRDGVPMIDYSSQEPGERARKHAETIDLAHFQWFIDVINDLGFDGDIVLEIKDKERSAVKALDLLKAMGRV